MTGERRASSGSPWEEKVGFSRAVRVGDHVWVSGTAPVWPDGSCDPDAGAQAARCFQIIEAALADVGARMEHVVRTRMFITDASDSEAVGAVHSSLFSKTLPSATMLVVGGLLDPRWRVEIEAEALIR